MQCLRCQHKNRPQAKFCEECASPLDGATRTALSYADLKAEVEDLRPALGEALEQQTATSEILGVISQSPTDVRPVFDTIVQNARRLCGSDSASVLTYDGELIQLESLDNASPERTAALRQAYPMPANRAHATGRAILTGRPIHIPDVRE